LNEDDIVLKKATELFRGHHVEMVYSNSIADEGGVLNCISWNIRIEDKIAVLNKHGDKPVYTLFNIRNGHQAI
jgi:hypothetical protein